MIRKSLLPLALLVCLLAFPRPGYACSMCKDAVESNPQLAAGYNWSIIVLASLPFVVIATITLRTMRALNPTAYEALKQRARDWVWPKGWLYLASGIAALTLLFYVTTPPDPITRLRLPYATLEAEPTVNPHIPLPPLNNQIVVVTFFASWCPPCVEQIADLTQLRSEFASQGMAVVAVNIFEQEATPPGILHLHPDGTLHFHQGALNLPSFIATNHVRFPVLVSTPALLASFGGVTRIPATFVFDTEGRLVKRYVNEPRGDFVRPKLEDLRGAIRGALACGQLSIQEMRQACIFLRDKNAQLGLEPGPR